MLGNAQANPFKDFNWEIPLNTFKKLHPDLKEKDRKTVVQSLARNVHEAFHQLGVSSSVFIPLDMYDQIGIKLLPNQKNDFMKSLYGHFAEDLEGFDVNSVYYAIPYKIDSQWEPSKAEESSKEEA